MPAGEMIMALLKDVNIKMEQGLKNYFANYGMSVTQLAVVTLLGKNERMKQTELSAALQVSPAAVSLLLNRLEERGLILRTRSKEDKRVVYVSLTEQFQRSHGTLESNVDHYLNLLLREASDREVQTMIAGLEALKQLLVDGEAMISKHVADK